MNLDMNTATRTAIGIESNLRSNHYDATCQTLNTSLNKYGNNSLRIEHLVINGVQFNNIKFLGEGTFGAVYRAVYGGVECAIKRQDFDQNFGYVYTVQDFERECLLHCKLHHPNVVKMYARMYGVCYHSEKPDQPIKVMELLSGGTLLSLLSSHYTIPMYVKLSILQDVSKGVHYLHTHKPPIMHRLLNIDTILLTSTLTAKIGSFTYSQEARSVDFTNYSSCL